MRYRTGRYISTSEAVWRILSFHIHKCFPPVFQMDVRLEKERRVYFDNNNFRERVENPSNTTLMAFLKLCQEDYFAKTFLYENVSSYYTFDKIFKMFSLKSTFNSFNSMLYSFRQDGRPFFYILRACEF